MTIDFNARVFFLVRPKIVETAGGEKTIEFHYDNRQPTTFKQCTEAWERNRNKKGLFIFTKGQVREYKNTYKLKRNRTKTYGSKTDESKTSDTTKQLTCSRQGNVRQGIVSAEN